MLPKLEEFSIEELKKQLDNKKIDEEFLIEYVVKRDKVYNKLIDEVNRLRIEVGSKEEIASKYEKAIQELKNQQKEFIEYLENEIMEIRAKWGNALSNVSQLDVAMTVKAYEDILSKYKEIIGGDRK